MHEYGTTRKKSNNNKLRVPEGNLNHDLPNTDGYSTPLSLGETCSKLLVGPLYAVCRAHQTEIMVYTETLKIRAFNNTAQPPKGK